MKRKTKKIILISCIISVSLAVVHLINKFIFYINTFKEHLYSDNSHYYSWRFGQIHYTKKGNGPALLLVHDLDNTSSHYEWKDIVDKLAKTHTVYTIDLIGCGCSDKPKITYTNYLYVQLLSDFMRDVIQSKASIVCSRYSCSISIMASYIDPKLFDQLILINPRDIETINKYPTRKHRILHLMLNVPIIGTLLYNIKNSRCMIRKKFSKEYLVEKKAISRYIKAYSEAAHTAGSNSKYMYTSIRCHYTNTNVVHALKAMDTPITILLGSDCDNVQHTINEYTELNSEVKTVLLFNTKELPHIEKPSQVASIIASYL